MMCISNKSPSYGLNLRVRYIQTLFVNGLFLFISQLLLSFSRVILKVSYTILYVCCLVFNRFCELGILTRLSVYCRNFVLWVYYRVNKGPRVNKGL